MAMKKNTFLILTLFLLSGSALAIKNKVAQSGMTYLAISMGSRETAMGDAGTAISKGINGLWHNPAALADIKRFSAAINQVGWLIDTKLYGTAFAASLGKWGVLAVDVTYMDYGEIMGTKRVDKSVDYRGFVLTGDVGVEDYAVGLAYARRINDKFSLGFKVKRLHERLGRASYVVSEYDDPVTGEKIRTRKEKDWKLNDWGLDIGTTYDIGWKSLTFAMAMQNFSRDMKYWYEEFQAPMVMRMGMAMDVTDLFLDRNKSIGLLVAVDALHPNDHTERVHVGAELNYLQNFYLRAGYKFNHEVESLTLGLGARLDFSGLQGCFDYAYGSANYFEDIHRFSLTLSF
jgi:hypothetical protein